MGQRIDILSQTKTAETNTALVLAPDGTGKLGFRAETGGGAMSNPMTTQDDIIVGGVAGAPGRLAKGTDGQVLTVDPTTHHLVWATPGGGGGSGGFDLDSYALDGTYGDDFTTASLSGIWTRRNFTSGAETRQFGPMQTYMRIDTTGRSPGDAYLQTAPAGDWTFAIAYVPRIDVEVAVGLACVDSSGTGVLAQFYTSPVAVIVIGVTTYSTYAGTFAQAASRNDPLWLKECKHWLYLRKSGTDYFSAYSTDGEVWSDETAAYSSAHTVNRVGILLSPIGSIPIIIDIDWFNKIA